jgi:hypothetical protein
MAYSIEGDVSLTVFGAWNDSADDSTHMSWAPDRMRELEHLALGMPLSAENLGMRPARFLTDANLSRLGKLRDVYDRERTFFSWLGDPRAE